MSPDAGGATSTTAELFKACCADLYGQDLVALLLGQRFHPGGADLTRRLADLLGLGRGERVLDVASGTGTTARLLARERGVVVTGVDLSARLVERARRHTLADGLDGSVRFLVADAERLRFRDGSFDVVVCECALCTFPDPAAALAAAVRVLAPGGRLGLADVIVDAARLPPELEGPMARIACVAGARSLEGYAALLEDAGFRVTPVERHDEAALGMVDEIADRVEPLRPAIGGMVDLAALATGLASAREAIADGVIGYALFTAVPERSARDVRGGDG
ncbi:MAG: hypothetical protein KatS3mg014_0771 [Actinomycetota bacterium]|nr:MAG: hypothetical protein KatS3mg014_0771 [Actinomycetota bacterium]